jgi:hypothetical protein
MKSHNDTENYRKMSEPFENIEIANGEVEKFFDMVEKARNECHIADAHVIVQFGVIGTDGKEGTAITSLHLGFSMNAARMCAWSLGQEEAEAKQMLRELVAGNKK